MITYDERAIAVVPNFIEQNRLSALKKYVLSNKSNEAKQVFLFSDIEDTEIKEIMLSIESEVKNYITNEYLADTLAQDVIENTWSRELELIRWIDGSVLAPHYDGDAAEDAFAPPPEHAKIGSLVYINDDYDGGEIGFPDYGIKIKPSPGDLVIFPFFYMHEVHLVNRLDPEVPSHRITMPMFNDFVLKT